MATKHVVYFLASVPGILPAYLLFQTLVMHMTKPRSEADVELLPVLSTVLQKVWAAWAPCSVFKLTKTPH